ADQDQAVTLVLVGVFEHLEGNVHVGAFLLVEKEASQPDMAALLDGAVEKLRLILPHDDRDGRFGGAQSVQIGALSKSFIPGKFSGEVINLADIVIFSKASKESAQVEPLQAQA